MSELSPAPAGLPGPQARLFEPGQRLGWTFRDRGQAYRPYPHPEPVAEEVPEDYYLAAEDASAMFTARRNNPFVLFLFGLAVVFLLLGTLTASVIIGLAAVFFAAVPAAFMGLVAQERSSTRQALAEAESQVAADNERRWQQWQAQKSAHEAAEGKRLARLHDWGAVRVPPGTRRLEVFGGNLQGWESLLTVFGASTLAERPLTLVDLSREQVGLELARFADAMGHPVDVQTLPDELDGTTLLDGLTTRELVDALVESMYGDEPHAGRAERAMDDRILTSVCDALGENVTLARMGAALRALMGQTHGTDALTRAERNRITDELFTDEWRRQAHFAISRIESYLHPLEPLGSAPRERTEGHLTCFALQGGGGNVRSELLTDLLVQGLTHRLAAASDDRLPVLVIAGADDLARRHLERLSDICERRGVQLVLLFRHLRDTARQMLGGGLVALMRLGNHEEAARGAEYVGRHHKFVLSQLTRSLGGSETYTVAETDGGGVFFQESAGWSRAPRVFGAYTAHRSKGGGTSRNWSTTLQHAEATSRTEQQSVSRVHEFTVEPTDLQNLPDLALLLVAPGTPARLQAVECNPALVTLSHVSMDPHPDEPPPEPDGAPSAPQTDPPPRFDPHAHPGPKPPPWAPGRRFSPPPEPPGPGG